MRNISITETHNAKRIEGYKMFTTEMIKEEIAAMSKKGVLFIGKAEDFKKYKTSNRIGLQSIGGRQNKEKMYMAACEFKNQVAKQKPLHNGLEDYAEAAILDKNDDYIM